MTCELSVIFPNLFPNATLHFECTVHHWSSLDNTRSYSFNTARERFASYLHCLTISVDINDLHAHCSTLCTFFTIMLEVRFLHYSYWMWLTAGTKDGISWVIVIEVRPLLTGQPVGRRGHISWVTAGGWRKLRGPRPLTWTCTLPPLIVSPTCNQ